MKKKLTADDIVNWWLEKYHNTNMDKILEEHPEWADGDHHREFYAAYQVTQAQHDEWYEWFIGVIQKEFKVSKKYAKSHSWVTSLNTAPRVKN